MNNTPYISAKMKRPLLFLALSLLQFYTMAQIGQLVWEDNFDQGQLNLAKWSYETGTGVNGNWGTGQLDRATSRTENVSFQNSIPGAENGCLVITTRKEFYIDRNYTSGRIRTAGKAAWGPGHRIVARIFPRDVQNKGQGFAFWMMPNEIPEGWNYLMWPQGGEIDIMEYVGSIPFHNLGSVHYAWFWENNQWQAWNHGHQGAYYSYQTEEVPIPADPGQGGYPVAPGAPNAGSSGFHTYGIDWFDDRIEFFVDDQVYHIHYLNDGGIFARDGQDALRVMDYKGRRVAFSEYSNHFEQWRPFEHEMYAILSAGVGGSSSTYGGSVVPEAVFPCSVFIDWVRVYRFQTLSFQTNSSHSGECKITLLRSSGKLDIQLYDSANYLVQVFDLRGTLLQQAPLSSLSIVNFSDLQRGVYLIRVSNGQRSFSQKILW